MKSKYTLRDRVIAIIVLICMFATCLILWNDTVFASNVKYSVTSNGLGIDINGVTWNDFCEYSNGNWFNAFITAGSGQLSYVDNSKLQTFDTLKGYVSAIEAVNGNGIVIGAIRNKKENNWTGRKIVVDTVLIYDKSEYRIKAVPSKVITNGTDYTYQIASEFVEVTEANVSEIGAMTISGIPVYSSVDEISAVIGTGESCGDLFNLGKTTEDKLLNAEILCRLMGIHGVDKSTVESDPYVTLSFDKLNRDLKVHLKDGSNCEWLLNIKEEDVKNLPIMKQIYTEIQSYINAREQANQQATQQSVQSIDTTAYEQLKPVNKWFHLIRLYFTEGEKEYKNFIKKYL